MKTSIESRVIDEANYIIETKKTVREIASIYGVSKSTVHKDLHERLIYISPNMFNEVDSILKHHADVRHIRGGEATKNKYKKLTD